MAKRRKQTQTEKEYNKQLRRIKRFIANAEKRGYQFKENVIPNKPSRVTKASVKKLQKITPDVLYKKAIYGGEATYGVIVSGKAGLEAERKYRANKRKERKTKPQDIDLMHEHVLEYGFSHVVVSNFKAEVRRFPKEISNKIISLVNTILKQQGEEDLAYALQNMPETFYDYLIRYAYDSDTAVQEFSTALIEYLPNASEAYKRDLMDAYEYNELGYTVED